MATKLKVLPKGHRIIETSHGNYIQKQKQSRRRYKTPAATRQKIAAAARRFHIPLLTTGAVVLPLSLAAQKAGGFNKIFTKTGSFVFFRELLSFYTGAMIYGDGSAKFIPQKMLVGLLPLAAVMAINRLGLFKSANQKLARAKIPLRLS